MKIKDALVSPNSKTVKTKNLILPLITRENRETSDEVQKYQHGDDRSVDQI